MLKNKLVALRLLSALMSVSGCAVNRATASLSPGTNMAKVVSAYVVKLPADVHHLDDVIKANLEKRGYLVTQGPDLAEPYNADIAVTYADRWMWDLTMYMIELTITVRNPSTGFPMAIGNSFHTSLAREPPEDRPASVASDYSGEPRM